MKAIQVPRKRKRRHKKGSLILIIINKICWKPYSSCFTKLWFVFLFNREKKWGASTNKVVRRKFHLKINLNKSLKKGMVITPMHLWCIFSSYNKSAPNLNCMNLFQVCFLAAKCNAIILSEIFNFQRNWQSPREVWRHRCTLSHEIS